MPNEARSSFLKPLSADAAEATLDDVFFALCDPIRRAILERLGEEALLVSEIAAPFEISLQAVSRHIQVLVRADWCSKSAPVASAVAASMLARSSQRRCGSTATANIGRSSSGSWAWPSRTSWRGRRSGRRTAGARQARDQT